VQHGWKISINFDTKLKMEKAFMDLESSLDEHQTHRMNCYSTKAVATWMQSFPENYYLKIGHSGR
jgi:hypothetical protein